MNFSPERLPNRNTIAQIKNKKLNKEFLDGTNADNITKDDNLHVSPACIKPNVRRRMGNRYRCPLCKKIVKRNDGRQWIKSFCDSTGKSTRLIKI